MPITRVYQSKMAEVKIRPMTFSPYINISKTVGDTPKVTITD